MHYKDRNISEDALLSYLYNTLKAIEQEADIIPHEEPGEYVALSKLEDIWTMAHNALEKFDE